VNVADRRVMERVYAVVNRMSSLGPSNPGDSKRIVEAFREVAAASRALTMALSCLNFGDHADAHSCLDDAERAVGLSAAKPDPGASS
jgi:hypothetical protein